MTPLDDARAIVLARCFVLGPSEVFFRDSLGKVLANDVVATENVPPFANTAVDGYAVRSADVVNAPVTLSVIGELAAGARPTQEVMPGTAIRIMTGAPIPSGCDAVVMVEETEKQDGDLVLIRSAVSAGASIRDAGSDVTKGTVVFTAGTLVTPAVLGTLASINARSVSVYRTARVGVLSTGDELVEDGGELEIGQIRESNRVMLLRLVEQAGLVAVDLGTVIDDESALETCLRSAINDMACDAIVSSGGVSMGDYDVVKAVLSRIADMSWMQIAMKPAKPFAFGTLRNTSGVDVPIFGLPGNPVSSLVSFELLARPALRMMSGFGNLAWRPRVLAILDDDIARKSDGKTHFDRGFAHFADDGRVHVTRTGPQGSHQLASTALANALIEVPDGDGLRAGDPVTVTFLGP
jgi:molybdenum cofactor synthesis domain-containing protein